MKATKEIILTDSPLIDFVTIKIDQLSIVLIGKNFVLLKWKTWRIVAYLLH